MCSYNLLSLNNKIGIEINLGYGHFGLPQTKILSSGDNLLCNKVYSIFHTTINNYNFQIVLRPA